MANFNPNITPKDTPMADIETNGKGKESCTSFARIDLTRNVDTIDLQEILVAGATTHLEPLSRNAEILERMDPNITIQVSTYCHSSLRFFSISLNYLFESIDLKVSRTKMPIRD